MNPTDTDVEPSRPDAAHEARPADAIDDAAAESGAPRPAGPDASAAACGRRASRTEADIRAAAFLLAQDRPVADITVDQIAQAAQVSRRTFFNHFATKNHAFIPEFTPFDPDVLERFATRAVPDLLDATEELVDSRAAMMTRAFADDSPGRDIRHRNPELQTIVSAAFRDSEDAVRPVSARRLGVPEDSPLAHTVAALVNMVERTALDLWRHAPDPSDFRDAVHQTVDSLRAALRE